MEGGKICRQCGIEKNLSDYYCVKGKPVARCKECVYSYIKEKRTQNRIPREDDPVGLGEEGKKWCRRCLKWVDCENFYSCVKNTKLKYFTYCRPCMSKIVGECQRKRINNLMKAE